MSLVFACFPQRRFTTETLRHGAYGTSHLGPPSPPWFTSSGAFVTVFPLEQNHLQVRHVGLGRSGHHQVSGGSSAGWESFRSSAARGAQKTRDAHPIYWEIR